jgi:hypothetical protein
VERSRVIMHVGGCFIPAVDVKQYNVIADKLGVKLLIFAFVGEYIVTVKN